MESRVQLGMSPSTVLCPVWDYGEETEVCTHGGGHDVAPVKPHLLYISN